MKRMEKHEIERVLMAASGTVRGAIKFMAKTGARVSEALAMTARDIDVIEGIARIRTLKNPKHPIRRIKIGSHFAGVLVSGKSGGDKLFMISRQGVHKAMKLAAKKSGVDPSRVHPHALRHSWAIAQAAAGVPVPVLKNWLGHASLATTTIYTEEVEAMKWTPAEAM